MQSRFSIPRGSLRAAIGVLLAAEGVAKSPPTDGHLDTLGNRLLGIFEGGETPRYSQVESAARAALGLPEPKPRALLDASARRRDPSEPALIFRDGALMIELPDRFTIFVSTTGDDFEGQVKAPDGSFEGLEEQLARAGCKFEEAAAV